MVDNKGHIEELFRNKFSDFSVQPSPGVWSKLAGKLFLREFLSFDYSSFNIYYLSAAVGIVATGIALLTGLSDRDIPENLPQSNLKQVETTLKPPETDQAQPEITAEEKAAQTPESIPEEKIAAETESARTKEVKVSKEDNLEPVETILEPSETILKQKESTPKLSLKPPIAEYSASATQGCSTLTVQFTNRSQYADSDEWHFGDGAISREENPIHTYGEPGEYGVSLQAVGAGGEVKIFGETIRVYEPPEASFVITPEDVTIPEEQVTFINRSKNAVRYQWDFGDLSVSAEKEPVHYYMEEGDYDVRLDVWNEAGCHDSMIVEDAFASSGCRIEFPTAFAPNPNGPSNGYYTDGPTANEVFHPVCRGVVEYRLRVYNRTGSLIFESNDVNIGWDGYFKGALAKQDVYVWKVQGRFRNGKEFMEQGNVTLIVKK